MTIPATSEMIRHPLRMRMLDVVALERPSPRLARVTLAGADLDGFRSLGASDHVKLFVPEPDQHVARVPELGPNGIVPPPPGSKPASGRDYTPKHELLADGRLQIDVVIHPGGRAAEWAGRAELGDVVGVAGPRGSRVFRSAPEALVLAGDETALPAIQNFLFHATPEQRFTVVVEVDCEADRQPLTCAGSLDASWVYRRSAPAGGDGPLAAAVAELDAPGPTAFCWAAGENETVARIRRVYLDRWGIDTDQVDARSYWRHGTADHQEPHDD